MSLRPGGTNAAVGTPAASRLHAVLSAGFQARQLPEPAATDYPFRIQPGQSAADDYYGKFKGVYEVGLTDMEFLAAVASRLRAAPTRSGWR